MSIRCAAEPLAWRALVEEGEPVKAEAKEEVKEEVEGAVNPSSTAPPAS